MPSVMAASIVAFGTHGDQATVPCEGTEAPFNDFTEKAPALKIQRPERGSLPPKWAIAGPSADLMTHSGLSVCDQNQPEHYGFYEAPEAVRGTLQNNQGEMIEGLLLDSRYRIMYPLKSPLKDAKYDLWVHFHGRRFFEREWIKVMRKTILVTLHIPGLSGGYIKEFSMPHHWNSVQRKISEAVSARYRTKADVYRTGLSGWSAGCAALERISVPEMPFIDGMICLDGLHGTYRGPDNEAIRDFSRFRQAVHLPLNLPDYSLMAALGGKFLGISHSSVPCSGTCQAGDTSYASTTATARNMIWSVGGTQADLDYSKTDTGDDPYAVYNRYDQGHFHVIARKGADGAAHCRVFDDVAPFLEKAKKEVGFE